MSYLCYLCLFAHSGVKYILCCVFLRLVYLILPDSLDCPFLIASSVFSNVYLSSSVMLIDNRSVSQIFNVYLSSSGMLIDNRSVSQIFNVYLSSSAHRQ